MTWYSRKHAVFTSSGLMDQSRSLCSSSGVDWTIAWPCSHALNLQAHAEFCAASAAELHHLSGCRTALCGTSAPPQSADNWLGTKQYYSPSLTWCVICTLPTNLVGRHTAKAGATCSSLPLCLRNIGCCSVKPSFGFCNEQAVTLKLACLLRCSPFWCLWVCPVVCWVWTQADKHAGISVCRDMSLPHHNVYRKLCCTK